MELRLDSGVGGRIAPRAIPHRTALVAGTAVLTLDGALPVEYLTPGDRIVTRSGAVTLRGLHGMRIVMPAVALRAGAIGPGKPERDMVLPAAQGLFLREADRRRVMPVSNLVDGETVRELGPRRLTIWALSFDFPEVLYAEGLELAAAAARAELA